MTKVKKYHSNGNLEEIGCYKDGKKHGEWKFYYRDGWLIVTGQYDNGKRNGAWREYTNAGELCQEIEYNKGKVIKQRFIGDQERKKVIDKIGMFKAKKEGWIL